MKETKTVLVTGANGFLGKHIYRKMLAQFTVCTVGQSAKNTYSVDLAKAVPAFSESFDMVIHVAGKAHVVPKTKQEEDAFYNVNYHGTMNLIKGLEQVEVRPKSFVFISTSAVYGKDAGLNLTEDTPLEGQSPYAKSKIQAEEYVKDWCAKKGVTLTILRLPLVVGKEAPGNLQAMIRMMKKGWYVGVGNGEARKSMVLAEDVAAFIPTIKDQGGIYNLTDGYHPSVKELELGLAKVLNKRVRVHVNVRVLSIVARIGDAVGNWFPLNTYRLQKLTSSLTFDDKRARAAGWVSRPVLEHLNTLV